MKTANPGLKANDKKQKGGAEKEPSGPMLLKTPFVDPDEVVTAEKLAALPNAPEPKFRDDMDHELNSAFLGFL